MSLAAVQKAKVRQHSRPSWILKGDTVLILVFFQLHANARRRKFLNVVKQKVAAEFFAKAVGTRTTRTRPISWEMLSYSLHNLDELDMLVTEHELVSIIKELPLEKAPMVLSVFSRSKVGRQSRATITEPKNASIQ